MSTLPAGFSITSINGKRCTAVPRAAGASDAASATPTILADIAAAAVAATTSAPAAFIPPATQIAAEASPVTTSQVNAEAATQAASTPPVPTPTPLPTPTPALNVESAQPTSSVIDNGAGSGTQQASVSSTLSDGIPTTILSSPIASVASTTSRGVALSEIAQAPEPTSTADKTGFAVVSSTPISSASPSSISTESSPAFESATAMVGSSSTQKFALAPVIGGAIGGAAFLVALGALWWFFVRRRRNRDSYLTPLWLNGEKGSPPKTYYEIDRDSLGPTKRSAKWKAQAGFKFGNIMNGVTSAGSALKAKVQGHKQSPSVNMNRGNSQFIQPIPQHSRNNSTMSNGTGHLSARDKITDWWERLTADAMFNWQLKRQVGKKPVDPFRVERARQLEEQQAAAARSQTPDFSHYLAMKDHELRGSLEHRRSVSVPAISRPKSPLGSLGLDFNDSDANPFADPRQPTLPSLTRSNSNPPFSSHLNQLLAPEPLQLKSQPTNPNPFTDPPSHYKPNLSRPPRTVSNYVNDIRRSRAPSIGSVVGPASRYPSTIRTSNESFRDTVFSTSSLTGRRGKGRSDPFDLERPDLWRPIAGTGAGGRMSTTLSDVEEGLSTGGSKAIAVAVEVNAAGRQGVSGANGQGFNDEERERGRSHSRIGSVPVMQARVVSLQKTNSTRMRVESGASFTSKYSSGSSALFSEWGDPGPDLGPVSGRSGNTMGSGAGGVGTAI